MTMLIKVIVMISLVVLSSWIWTSNLENPDLAFIMSVLSGGFIGWAVGGF